MLDKKAFLEFCETNNAKGIFSEYEGDWPSWCEGWFEGWKAASDTATKLVKNFGTEKIK